MQFFMEILQKYIWLIIFAIVIIFVFMTIYILRKKKEHVEEVKMKKDIELSDRLFKPAQISVRYVYAEVLKSVEKYIQAVYNNNPMMLPEKISKELLQETLAQIQRKNQLGVQMKLIKYEAKEPFEVKQDNSSVYTVMYLNATAEYRVEYFTEHSTYKRYITKDVTQEFVFEGTNNDGWMLKSIGEEEVISKEQKDI